MLSRPDREKFLNPELDASVRDFLQAKFRLVCLMARTDARMRATELRLPPLS